MRSIQAVEGIDAAIERLARLTPLHLGEEAPAGPAMQVAAGEDAFIIPLEGHVDVEAEKARLTKAMEASQKEFGSLDKRLSNPSFVEKAKPEAVEKAKADAAFHASEIDRLRAGEGQGPLVLPRRKEEAGHLDDTAGSPDDTLRDEVGNG